MLPPSFFLRVTASLLQATRSKRTAMAHGRTCNAADELQQERESEARGDNANIKRQRLEEIEEKGVDILTSNSLLASLRELHLQEKE